MAVRCERCLQEFRSYNDMILHQAHDHGVYNQRFYDALQYKYDRKRK